MPAQITAVASQLPRRRLRGNCKWFDCTRGFGFIGGSDGRDYFVHQTAIKSKGWRSLEVNQEVEFEVVMDKNRLQAKNVTTPGGLYLTCEERKQTEVCLEYKKRGSCIYGTTCKFSHSLTDRRNSSMPHIGLSTSRRVAPGSRGHSSLLAERVHKGICYLWRRGECRRAELCRYDHPLDQRNFQLFPNRNEGICYPWQEGKCNKGEKCKFIHFPTE